MNTEQALQIITNLANLTASNGGIYQSIEEASTVALAINTLKTAIEPKTGGSNTKNK